MEKPNSYLPVNRNYLGHSVILMMMLAVYLLIASDACAESKIRLGYLTDLSGKSAFLGRQSAAGANLAKLEFAETGVSLDLVFEDHQTDPAKAVTGVKKILDVDKVDAVICDLTPPSLAVSPLVLSAGKMFLYQAPATSLLTTNPYALKNFLDYRDGCRAIAKYWKERGIIKVGHLKLNTEFGELCYKGVSEVYSDQEVEEYNSGDDLRSLITKFKQKKVQVLFQTGYEGDYVNRFRNALALGFKVPAGMPEPLVTAEVIKQAAEGLDATVTFGFPALADSFVEKLKRHNLYVGQVNIQSAAIAYLYTRAAVLALRSCKGSDLACQLRVAQEERAPEFPLSGWKDRIAQYDYSLKSWNQGRSEFIK